MGNARGHAPKGRHLVLNPDNLFQLPVSGDVDHADQHRFPAIIFNPAGPAEYPFHGLGFVALPLWIKPEVKIHRGCFPAADPAIGRLHLFPIVGVHPDKGVGPESGGERPEKSFLLRVAIDDRVVLNQKNPGQGIFHQLPEPVFGNGPLLLKLQKMQRLPHIPGHFRKEHPFFKVVLAGRGEGNA